MAIGRAINSTGGSPPHAWGILPATWPARPCPRFTPTRVGNTSHRGFSMPCPAGSPPHAWGIRLLPKGKGGGKRFTPTRVGNTGVSVRRPGLKTGSPPHAWGIRRASLRSMWPRRFTPTRVGNTPAGTLSAIAKSGSPPHAWGIRLSVTNCTPVPSGSPPHAWGILHSLGVSVRGWPVHPHTRGEYSCRCRWSSTLSRFTPTRVGNTTYRIQLIPMTIGSPPHAWGIRGLEVQEGVGDRFTPTRVGNTRGYCPPVRPASRFTPTRVGNTDSAPASAT